MPSARNLATGSKERRDKVATTQKYLQLVARLNPIVYCALRLNTGLNPIVYCALRLNTGTSAKVPCAFARSLNALAIR
jgi:hypothetical protein